MPADLTERFMLRVQKEPHGCWTWTGARWKRYGKFCLPGDQKRVAAHRWAYEHFVGPVPAGLVLDHLCRNVWCVNPEHLEPVTQTENVRRGIAGAVNAARQRSVTHCPAGHEYTPENTYYRNGGRGRNCRACGRANTRKYKAARKASAA